MDALTITPHKSGSIHDALPFIKDLYPSKVCEIWVDGSYFDKKSNRAGTGAVIIDPENSSHVAFCLAFNISNIRIRHSRHAELWAATLAMEVMTDLGVCVRKLTCDSPVTKHRIAHILNDASHSKRYMLDRDEYFELYSRLGAVLNIQPGMLVKHVNRKTRHMPLADHFARKAAERRIGAIAQMPLDKGYPCFYFIMNGEGEIRQTFFYDHIENYGHRKEQLTTAGAETQQTAEMQPA